MDINNDLEQILSERRHSIITLNGIQFMVSDDGVIYKVANNGDLRRVKGTSDGKDII